MSSRIFITSLISLSLVAVACGDDTEGSTGGADATTDTSAPDAQIDAGVDGAIDDAGVNDASADGSALEPCAVIAKLDADNDGTYERITRSTEWTEGNRLYTVTETDNDADGTYDSRDNSVRDAETFGRLEHSITDLATNETRVRITAQYDEQDRLAVQEFDNDFNGVINSRTTRSYHDNGELAEVLQQTDSDQDGTFDASNRTLYDAAGKITRRESDQAGDDPNGDAIDAWETWEYEGRTTKHSEFDTNGLIRYDENDYDEMGRWLRFAESPNGDTDFTDPADQVTTFVWNGNVRTSYIDGPSGSDAPDGTPEFEETTTFDNEGHLIAQENMNAAGEVTFRFKRTWDGDRIIKEEWDQDSDGIYELVEAYSFTPYGDEISFEQTESGELISSRYATYEYDSGGNMTLCERDDDGDGTLEEVQTWLRDDEGRPIKHTRDDRTDELDTLSITDYEYVCPDSP